MLDPSTARWFDDDLTDPDRLDTRPWLAPIFCCSEPTVAASRRTAPSRNAIATTDVAIAQTRSRESRSSGPWKLCMGPRDAVRRRRSSYDILLPRAAVNGKLHPQETLTWRRASAYPRRH